MDGVAHPNERSRISVIVPVLHDTEALRRLLLDLAAQTRLADQIIVVSGTHDEALSRLAEQRQFELIEDTPSRGRQLDTGARAASSDILWFIHADARLPGDACEAIVGAIESGCLGGCLRFELQGQRGIGKRLLEWLVRIRIACGGMAYGDQALFCTPRAYEESGGFPHWPLFEEVPLVKYMQRRGKFTALMQPVFVATRRWERDGWLRRSLHNRWLAMRFMLGATPEKLAAAYRRPESASPQPPAPANARQTHG
jgi:rSAM/selenodomain-associated transferase 2